MSKKHFFTRGVPPPHSPKNIFPHGRDEKKRFFSRGRRAPPLPLLKNKCLKPPHANMFLLTGGILKRAAGAKKKKCFWPKSGKI